MACLNPSLNLALAKLTCLVLLILFLVAEIAGSPVQIQSTPFEEVVNDEEKVVLYCKTTGVHLHWRVNSFTPGIFNGDEKVGAIKERTQDGNIISTAVLLSRALNTDNETVRTSVLILHKNFIQDQPINVTCSGEEMDRASYIVTENSSQTTESTSSETTTISLDNPTSTSASDFPTLGFEVDSAPSMSISLVLFFSHLLVYSLLIMV